MLQLIFYQFNYSKRQWLGTIPILLAASIVIGMCLMITFNVMANIDVFKRGIPTPLFIGPIFFGGITLLLLTSSLIQLLLTSFKKDYRLWTILGASRYQLSLLIGGQLAIIAFLVSIVGTFISFFMAHRYYLLVQNVTGKLYLPSIPMSFNFYAFILSIFILTIITFLGGFRYASKLLKQGNLLEERNISKKIFSKFSKTVSIFLVGLLWLGLIISSLVIPFIDLPGPSIYQFSFQVDTIFYLLIIHIVLLQLLSPWIETFFITFMFKWSTNYGMTMAKWNILLNRFYLKSLIVSLVTGTTLFTGLLLLSYNSIRSSANQAQETYVSFLLYLAAPIFIILANVISITIISSVQEKTTVQQWQTLGISKKNIIVIRLCEAVIYSVLVVIISLILNLIIAALVINTARTGHVNMIIMNYNHIYMPTVIISITLFILIFLTKIISSFGNNTV